jgi:hypothetical protein
LRPETDFYSGRRVRGNVAVISGKANLIKNFGTAEEHERIAAWLRAIEGSK